MIVINTQRELSQFIIDNKDFPIMLLFSASWCGPCQVLKKRLISDQETDMPNIKIGYCDVDNEHLEEIIDLWDVSSMPTSFFIKLNENNVEIQNRVIGCDWIKIVMSYNELNNNL